MHIFNNIRSLVIRMWLHDGITSSNDPTIFTISMGMQCLFIYSKLCRRVTIFDFLNLPNSLPFLIRQVASMFLFLMDCLPIAKMYEFYKTFDS